MGKISVNLDDTGGQESETATENAALDNLATGLPSAGKARIESFRRSPRTVWSFSQTPTLIKTLVEAKARENKMGLKEFLYHCLRLGGVDIPEYSKIHGRRG